MTVEIRCVVTGEGREVRRLKDGTPALPPGWKRVAGEPYSPEGFTRRFVPRTLTVPVCRAVIGYQAPFTEENTTAAWPEFRRALSASWRAVTQFSNWLLTGLAALDREPLASTGKPEAPWRLPPFKPDTKPLYALGRSQWPELDSQSFGQVLQAVRARYMGTRFGLRVLGSLSLPTFRFPTPLPVPAKDSELTLDGEAVCVRLRLGGMAFLVRLKSTDNFARQLDPLRKAACGLLPRGAVTVREGGKGDVLLACVVYLPIQAVPRETTEPFLVRTDPEALLVGELQGRREFILNEDQLKRWGKAHEEQLKRWTEAHHDLLRRAGEDRKAERRGRAPYADGEDRRRRRDHKKNFQRALERRCEKYHARVHDALHKVAAVVAGHAARRRVYEVCYDDSERGYMPWLPYHKLKTFIREKLGAIGIRMVGGGDPSPLTETEE